MFNFCVCVCAFGFLVLNVCNHGEYYETPSIKQRIYKAGRTISTVVKSTNYYRADITTFAFAVLQP